MEFKDRLRARMTDLEMTATDLSSRIGVSKSSITFWRNGTNRATGSNLMELAKALKCNPEWLETGKGAKEPNAIPSNGRRAESNASILGYIAPWDDETPLEDDEVAIPLLKDVRVAAGSGEISEEFFTGKKIRMGKYTLKNRGVSPENAVCVTVSGNSMEPALPDGSTVGMDRAQTAIKDGKVYVIKHDGELRVKQAYRRPGGGIRLRSFNQAEHQDEEYTIEQMAEKDIWVVGKVFWSSVLWD
ncbi:helix-turn-helix transcriptional regulator [Pseudomonas chlororaphis]|uniref:helix-turn-helix transcriptional regulator n=1 Tax=Pseudomonas chlororaphis TaxID=587753 RepID=UPI0023666D78|nr:helix-turn-helix transcriptional regulator [Pseudomonas chlororaphis]WDH25013.1 helix-turn-helix transcriptional regulator [Pseudomonas chlororaphis]